MGGYLIPKIMRNFFFFGLDIFQVKLERIWEDDQNLNTEDL